MLEIICCENDKIWDKFVLNNNKGTIAHLYGWKRIIENAYGHKSFYLAALENGELQGVLPLVLIKSRIFGKQLVSMPFMDYGGICADENSPAFLNLLEKSVEISKKLKVDFLTLRHLKPTNLELRTSLEKVTMVISLKKDQTEMLKNIPSERRNRIRKTIEFDLKSEVCSIEALDQFYAIFAVNMRDLGSPVHSKAFFKSVINEFRDMAKFILIKLEDKPIGAGLFLQFKDTIFLPWPCSLTGYRKYNTMVLLYWEVIKYGCQHGYSFFDLGRSSKGSGTYEFKRRWGAVPVQLFWEYQAFSENKKLFMKSEDNASRIAVETWKKLPVSVTKIIGPLLRKNIPN